MASIRTNAKQSNLKKIEGYPGIYTFVEVSRDPRKEKVLLDKISRDAARLAERLGPVTNKNKAHA